MSSADPPDERVIYREHFQGVYFDFRGKSIFTRYDRCEFVKCTLLIDHAKRMHHAAALVIVTCLCALGYGWNGRNPRNVSSYLAFAVDDAVSRHRITPWSKTLRAAAGSGRRRLLASLSRVNRLPSRRLRSQPRRLSTGPSFANRPACLTPCPALQWRHARIPN
jgi:hypothetical protein